MKKILWLDAGGTIACEKTQTGLTPVSLSDELCAGVLPDNVTVKLKSVFSEDSTNISPKHWQMLARTVADNYENYDGFVITHGTDTMQYTSAALHYMLNGLNKPVILTGSQKAYFEKDSDAPFNLACGFVAARDIPFGVYIVFGGKLIRGISAFKLCSKKTDAFIDTLSHAGTVSENSAALFNKEKQPSADFKLADRLCEKVFYLKITPNTSIDITEFIEMKGYRAVVVECYGLGGIPENILPGLKRLCELGTRVVAVSQCVYDGVDLNIYRVGQKALEAGIEDGETMTGSHALVKLMCEI